MALTGLLLIVGLSAAVADLCPEPVIPNGGISGRKSENFFSGQVRCDRGFQLIGNSRVKCRNGIWSGPIPVCTVLGACPAIETPINGRAIPVRGSRMSAFRFGCNRDFHLLGEKVSYCVGDSWSHEKLPVCARNTCDQTSMLDIPYGEALSMLGGAVYRYRCNEGVPMSGSESLYCDGNSWNGSVPVCLVAPAPPALELLVDGVPQTVVRPGDAVLTTCHAKTGNPVPEVQITFAGETSASMNFKNSLLVTVPEGVQELEVSCTASNSAGSATETVTVAVHSPPSVPELTGPSTILRNSNHQFQCQVRGGFPKPEVTWIVADSLTGERREKGEEDEEGNAIFDLAVGEDEQEITLTCEAENEEGATASSVSLPVHYLPATVSVSAPDSASVSSLIDLHCESAPSFPAASLKWRIVDQMEELVKEVDADVEEQEDGGFVAISDLRFDAGAGLLTAQCVAIVEEVGEVASDVVEVLVMDTTTTSTTTTSTSTTTTRSLAPPVVFGVRPGSILRPGDEVVLTCSAVVNGEGNLVWMVGGQKRGDGAELHKKDGKLISSWKYSANLDDKTVACVVDGEEERSVEIEVNVKEDGQETVTLKNMDEEEEEYANSQEYDGDYEEEEEYSQEYESEEEEDATEADAIENLSSSALTQEDQTSAFADSEPVARVPDAGLGESNRMGVSPKMKPSIKAAFSSSSSTIIPSLLSLLLAFVACVRHY